MPSLAQLETNSLPLSPSRFLEMRGVTDPFPPLPTKESEHHLFFHFVVKQIWLEEENIILRTELFHPCKVWSLCLQEDLLATSFVHTCPGILMLLPSLSFPKKRWWDSPWLWVSPTCILKVRELFSQKHKMQQGVKGDWIFFLALTDGQEVFLS